MNGENHIVQVKSIKISSKMGILVLICYFAFSSLLLGALNVPDSIDFGDVKIGQEEEVSIVLTNTGDWPLEINKVYIQEEGSQFSIISDSSFTVASDEKDSIKTVFIPESIGESFATMIINSNDHQDSTLSIVLHGNGTNSNQILTANIPNDQIGHLNNPYPIPIIVNDIDEIDEIYSFDFTVSYDSTLINITGYESEGSLSSECTLVSNTNDPGRVSLAMMSTSPISGNEGDAIVFLNAELNNVGESTLNIDKFIFNDGSPEVNPSNGSIQIICPPSFVNTIQDTTIQENDELNLYFQAIDENDETLNFSAVSIPDGASFDDSSKTFSWKTDYTDAGEYSAIISVTDGYTTVYDTTNINVLNVNQKPSFELVMPDTTSFYGQPYSFNYKASDRDGEDLSYKIVSGPEDASINSDGLLSWDSTAAGLTTFVISLDDGNDSISDTTIIDGLVWGDANLDYNVEKAYFSYDASQVLQYSVGLINLEQKALYVSDVSDDGLVNAFDASFLMRYSVDLIDKFPAETEAVGKEVIASGDIIWSLDEKSQNSDKVTIPIELSDKTENVFAIKISTNINASHAELSQLDFILPQNWKAFYDNSNGKLEIAFAGSTPMQSGTIAIMELDLMENIHSLKLDGDVIFNASQQFDISPLIVKEKPNEFSLDDNYPNPFNPKTTIKYQLPKESKVKIQIFDLTGNHIKTLVNSKKGPGYYEVDWQGMDTNSKQVPTGIYFYRISAGSYRKIKKMILTK